jgi:2-hydroxy-3-keto-5-methylthiopentenyl-1-phosphate phosphatase
MWAAVTLTWEEAWKDHLEGTYFYSMFLPLYAIIHIFVPKFYFSAVKVDPGFSSFYDYCKSVGVPVKIVSRYGYYYT